MKKKKPYKSKAKAEIANEPSVAYNMSKLRIFKSFEEMEEADSKEMAALSPIEHLQHVTEYIMYAYADELKNKMIDLTIYFK